MLATIALVVALAQATAATPTGKTLKQTFGAGGRTRTYYLFVPSSLNAAGAPLIVLLHGSGREGRSLIEPWAPLAKQHGIILAAPDSLERQHWNMREDGPDFLYALVEMLRVEHPVDPRRIYLFGHSAGAVHGLAMAILESEYFAAAAVHAGTLPPQVRSVFERVPRKIPLAIWVGTNDVFFPLDAVRATRDVLTAGGFPTALTEVPGHTHAYYDRAMEINLKVWEFLQKHRLEADPRYQQYQVGPAHRQRAPAGAARK